MFKKLNIRSGVVMGHPYEIAELAQSYANDNLKALTEALFETRGVLAPHGDELKPQVSQSNVDNGAEASVRPGFAVVGDGLIRVEETKSIILNREALYREGEVRLWQDGEWSDPLFPPQQGGYYFSLLYEENSDTPVKIVPYGNGEVDLRVVPSFTLTITQSVPDIQTGVPVGKIEPQDFDRGRIQDIRTDHAARLRADRTLLHDMVDPALVDDIETIFSRTDIVSDINDLFDNQKLSGERVVTRLKDAVDPFFVRTRYEPSARKTLRDLNTIDADLELRPDPSWNAEVEWNLYGVRATGISSTEIQVQTEYDLTKIEYQGYDLPLYLRFDGDLYPINQFLDASTVELSEEVSTQTQEDPNAAITNGADEFQITAEPGINWFRKNKRAKDFSVDDDLREPVGQLKLEPGFWNVIIQSKSQDSRATKTVGVEIPELLRPRSPKEVSVSGEQRTPAYEQQPADGGGGEATTFPANPFNNVRVDENGEPEVEQENLDRYIDRVREELNRVQEQEIALSIDINAESRNRGETKRAMTIGYKLTVEMLTGEGWKNERTVTVYRSTADLMRELTWVDLMSDRYRGSVTDKTDLENLSNHMGRLDVTTDSDRPIRENEIVHVSNDSITPENDGYWRYEPKMRDDQATGLTDENGNSIRTFAYNNSDGYWVQVDVERGSYDPQTVNTELTGVKGGTDYRVTVQPIGEDGQNGEKITKNTDELRDKFNAELGFDLHRAINDIHSGYQEMMDTIDPEAFNEYLDEQLGEIRKIIDQASLYGTPPKVTGPFDVPPKPGVTRFSGRNLGSVQKVFMRYAPPGNTDEEQIVEEANFKVMVGQGDPQVAIKNLPNLSQLSKEASPIVTMEFNAGARGSDFFTIRYQRRQPSVVGPNILSFKEDRVENIITGTTYGNTASFWRYDSRVGGSEEPTPYGPLPKRWPASEAWDSQLTVFDEQWGVVSDEPLDGYGPDTDFTFEKDDGNDSTPEDKQRQPEETETVRALQFRAKRMVPSDVLDIRIHNLPTEQLVPQIAYDEAERWDTQIGDPYYYALRYSNNQIEVLVPARSTSLWAGKSFALEYVYYPSTLSGGGLHDGRGVFLQDRGRQDSDPTNASVGDYYYNGASNQPRIYDKNDSGVAEWMDSELIEFRRHTFSVQRDPSSETDVQKTEARFILETEDPANEAALVEETGKLGYHTPEDADNVTPPFARTLINGAALELQAPRTVDADGTTYIFDEWRERANTFEKNRSSLPSNTRALNGERRSSDFGVPAIQSITSVKGTSVGQIIYPAKYRVERDFSSTGEGVLTVDRYEDGRAIVTFNSTDYLVEYSGTIGASAGTDLSATAIVLSGQEDWAGSSYPVLRATSVGEAGGEDLSISGPTQYTLNDGDVNETLEYTVNKDPLDSYNVGWLSTSLTNTDVSTSGTGSETLISVTIDWEDIFGSEDVILEEVRPDGAIGNTEYDGPLYREEEIFDFRSPTLRVEALQLRVEATVNGVTVTHYTAVQVVPYVE